MRCWFCWLFLVGLWWWPNYSLNSSISRVNFHFRFPDSIVVLLLIMLRVLQKINTTLDPFAVSFIYCCCYFLLFRLVNNCNEMRLVFLD